MVDPNRETMTTLKVKANSATTTLTLNSLRVICIRCGKPRNPDEAACCLKTGPYELNEKPEKITQEDDKREKAPEKLPPPNSNDPFDNQFFHQLDKGEV